MVAPALVTAGQATARLAAQYAPQAIEAAKDYLKKGGAKKALEAMAGGTVAEQAAVIKALHNGGLPAGLIANRIRELTPEETAKYQGLIDGLQAAESNAVDAAAIARPSSGDVVLDAGVRNKEIHDLCGRLDISSETLGLLLNFVRTGTHSEIERYQRDYRLQGWRPR